MSEKRYTPFSNGTQFCDWEESNCNRCQKVDISGPYDKSECPIFNALTLAYVDDGTVDEEIAKRMGYLVPAHTGCESSDPLIPNGRQNWPCPEVEWTEEWKAEHERWQSAPKPTPEEIRADRAKKLNEYLEEIVNRSAGVLGEKWESNEVTPETEALCSILPTAQRCQEFVKELFPEVAETRGVRMTTIGERLRLAREQAGMQVWHAAFAMELLTETIRDMEAGKIRPSKTGIEDLGYCYGVSSHWLETGEEEAKP